VEHPISEHIYSFYQAKLLLKTGAIDIFNVCTTFLGGISPARKLFALAEIAGVSCLIGTTQELSIGTAAQAHLGSSVPGLDYPSDPTGPRLYLDDVVREPVVYDHGFLLVPAGPGLGLEIDPERVKSLQAPLESGEESLPSIQDRTAPFRSVRLHTEEERR
jgi:muconate cycloisomerase